MINAQRSLLGLGATAIAAVSTVARAKEGMEAKEKSKRNYELAAQQKQENIKLAKARLAEVEARTANAEALNKAKVKKINAETKQIKSKTALNAANTDLKTAKTAKINAKVERIAKLAEEPAAVEAPTVEAKKPVQSFGELAGVEEAPAPEQKYISSEEGAYLPIKAENTETKIPVDEDVQGLIQAKQKNMKRSISASRAQKEYQASKGYENDFPIRDYMPNVSDAELRKAGITKTELNKLSSILAGNGTDEDVRN